MKKWVLFLLVFSLCFLMVGCQSKTKEKKKEKNMDVKKEITMNIKIDEKNYVISLEDNETSEELLKHLPLEFTMQELNGNEKYYDLDFSLPMSTYEPKTIQKGDVMLFGSNCLVIFYKTFDTSYSYTKIGTIENLEDLGRKNVSVKLEK